MRVPSEMDVSLYFHLDLKNVLGININPLHNSSDSRLRFVAHREEETGNDDRRHKILS